MVFSENVEKKTLKNKSYRKVEYTDNKLQLVYMSIKPLDNIHIEQHKVDQFIKIEKGQAEATINGKKIKLKNGSAIIIPSGYKHEIRNTSKTEDLKIYTVYTPPQHSDKLEQKLNPDK
jgi:mannose-6-phosphate isomerase-like protein (cupin superfamily)